MNRVKKTLILAGLACPMIAVASDFAWLAFRLTDGTEMSVAAEGLAINYNEGILILKSATVDQSLPTDLIKSMRFTTSSTAVEEISDVFSSEADYFDLSGKNAGRFATADEARKTLSSGTYIVRSKDKIAKVIF